jgi:cytochrome o ubiquinol oxidase operon protein cyoD
LTYSPGRGCRLPSPVAENLPIVLLVMCGSLWIMANLNHNMMPMDQLMQMQR